MSVWVRFKMFLRSISIEDLSTMTAFAIVEVSWIYSHSKAISFTQAILNGINKHLGKRSLVPYTITLPVP